MKTKNKEYNFAEYPTSVIKINGSQWVARIKNWDSMIGVGKSEEEAIKNLMDSFNKYKKKNKLPEPGEKIKYSRAENKRIKQNKIVAKDFMKKILDLDYHNSFVSDESKISDFDIDFSVFKKRVFEEYKLKVSKKDLSLVELFEKIAKV